MWKLISGVNAKVPVIYTLFPIDEAQLISMSTKIFSIVGGRGRGCGEGWEQGHHSWKASQQCWWGALSASGGAQQNMWWSRKTTWSARRKAMTKEKEKLMCHKHSIAALGWAETHKIPLISWTNNSGKAPLMLCPAKGSLNSAAFALWLSGALWAAGQHSYTQGWQEKVQWPSHSHHLSWQHNLSSHSCP